MPEVKGYQLPKLGYKKMMTFVLDTCSLFLLLTLRAAINLLVSCPMGEAQERTEEDIHQGLDTSDQ